MSPAEPVWVHRQPARGISWLRMNCWFGTWPFSPSIHLMRSTGTNCCRSGGWQRITGLHLQRVSEAHIPCFVLLWACFQLSPSQFLCLNYAFSFLFGAICNKTNPWSYPLKHDPRNLCCTRSHRSTDYRTQRGDRVVWRRLNWIWRKPGRRGQLLSQQKSFFMWYSCRTEPLPPLLLPLCMKMMEWGGDRSLLREHIHKLYFFLGQLS